MEPSRREQFESGVELVAGRYRVLSELARGGMGVVCEVLDESTGRRVALKRLSVGSPSGATRRKGAFGTRDAELHFRLEYAMLSRLRHPSILEVYDYGVDRGKPYFTMELLDGNDLGELAPLPFRDACRRVRDVASSLALLHAHRLVHRDVSPRNVRLTGEGRCKLLDFGTLTPFGVPRDVAGTPASVAPEALEGGAIDHRADLYAVGALLYFLLTGHDAFPARSLDELPLVLSSAPLPPSASSPGVPAALDALVLALLSPDPLARPATAAEVIERLDAVGELAPEERHGVEQGYLLSGKTVGRGRETHLLSDVVERATAFAGGAVLVRGARGMGKTRTLGEVALHAKLRGATVLSVDAGLDPSSFGTARLLGDRLLELAPSEAVLAAGVDAGVLAHSFPELRAASLPASRRSGADAPGEWSARLLAAQKAWFLRFAERHPLVILVDDLERADDASLGLVASLARSTAGRNVAVVGAIGVGAPGRPALEVFGCAIDLGPLDMEATTLLVRSLFTDVPHVQRLSRWLLETSRGVPLHVMELLSHLVSARVVRYSAGGWSLPAELPVALLPKSGEEAILARIERLVPRARHLAEALSVAQGPVPLGACLALAEADLGSAASEALLLLDDLVTAGVLVGSRGAYRFADGLVRDVLRARVEAERCRRLHLELGETLLATHSAATRDVIAAGWHLLQGGDEERGATLLAEFGRRLFFEADDIHAAVPALEAALRVYRARARPPHEIVALVGPLASASFFVDRRLAEEYGAEALELFRRETGVARAEELRSVLGERVSLGVGVAAAAIERRLAASDGSQVSTGQLLEMFLRCAMTLSGVATVSLDGRAVRRVIAALEPLGGLGPRHAAPLVLRYATHLLDLCEGRVGAARRGLSAMLVELEGKAPRVAFPEEARRLFIGGALYALGAIESLSDGPSVLSYAAKLDALDLGLYRTIAEQMRMMYHAHRGESDLVERYRERVDRLQAEGGPAWQIDVWEAPAMLLVHLREGNVVSLKRSAERLNLLVAELPSLEPQAKLARAAHLLLRGELRAAGGLLREVLEAPHSSSPARGPAAGLLASVETALGRPAEAERLTRDLLEGLGPGDRAFTSLFLGAELEHARAVERLGAPHLAARELDAALDCHSAGRGPTTLGLLHEARAELALRTGDPHAFEHHFRAMQGWFRPTENPALVARCERLKREGRRGLGAPQSPLAHVSERRQG